MDIETKKTTLDDEASIYQKRKNTYTKEDIKDMSGKEKLKYFKDYYLKIVIIALVAIVAIGILIKDIVFDRSESILYVSCVNECQISNTDKLADELKEFIKPEKEDDFTTVVSYDLNNTQFNMSFVTLLNAGSIDLVVCPYDYFVEASGAGTFVNLSEFLPEEIYNSLSDKILTASLTETDIDGNVIDSAAPEPFGIDISDNKYFAACAGNAEKVVLCAVNGTMHEENVLKAITYLTAVE